MVWQTVDQKLYFALTGYSSKKWNDRPRENLIERQIPF